MRDTPYGILLVSGSHTHQEDYAEAFAADPRCRLIAVTDEADIDPQRRAWNEQLAAVHRLPYAADLSEALTRPDVDVVSICAPPERRGRIALRCAEAGKHLYLDKSLTPRLDEADALVAAVQKAGIRSHMFSFITQPWAQAARHVLAKGQLGRLRAIHVDVFFAKGHAGTATLGRPRQEEYPPERHQQIESKRELDNIGVYAITLVHWLTRLTFRSVFAVTANYFFREHQQQNVEDFGLVSGVLEDGLPVTLAVGRFGWTAHPGQGVRRLLLIGSERHMVIDANLPRLEVYNDEPPWTPPAVHPLDPMSFWTSTPEEVHVQPKLTWVPLWPSSGSDASYFLDCLGAGRESEMSVVPAAQAAEVLLGAYQSAHTRKAVSLPLPRL
jgi:predicted dehydrogenase